MFIANWEIIQKQEKLFDFAEKEDFFFEAQSISFYLYDETSRNSAYSFRLFAHHKHVKILQRFFFKSMHSAYFITYLNTFKTFF